MKGNFKVRCIDRNANNCYTNGKVYEFMNGDFSTTGEVKLERISTL